MKLIDVDCLFEKSKIIFYFTAESRVDFRELVKDLVQKFKMTDRAETDRRPSGNTHYQRYCRLRPDGLLRGNTAESGEGDG